MAKRSEQSAEPKPRRDTLRAFVLAILLALGIRTFLFEPFKIPSGSMIPTLLVGDHIYAGHGHNKGFPICVELESGKVAWGGDIRNEGTDSATVLYADGRIYFRYQNGMIILIEASPGGYAEKGTLEIPEVTLPSWPHLAIAGGKLFVREQDTLYCYDVKER